MPSNKIKNSFQQINANKPRRIFHMDPGQTVPNGSNMVPFNQTKIKFQPKPYSHKSDRKNHSSMASNNSKYRKIKYIKFMHKATVPSPTPPPIVHYDPTWPVWQKAFTNEPIPIFIIIPYRNRSTHYHKFMKAIASLTKSPLHDAWDVCVIVVEQADTGFFGRANLLNIGIDIALKMLKKQNFSIPRLTNKSRHSCIVTHDVDMVPRAMVDYAWCVPMMSQPCSDLRNYMKFNTTIEGVPYHGYAGGTVAGMPEHWIAANGYTNNARGWGGEDDDL